MKRNRWKKALLVSGILLALVFSFWYGGDSEGLRGFSISSEQEADTNRTSGNDTIKNDRKTVSQNSTDSGTEAAKPEEEKNIFQQIIMHVTKKKSTADTSKKTQSNKRAQKNAARAAEKAGKKQSKKKQSSAKTDKKNSENGNSQASQTAQNTNTQTDRNSSQTDTVQNNQPTPDAQTNQNAADSKDSGTINCTIYISCAVLLEHMDWLTDAKKKTVPADGLILNTTPVRVKKGGTVFDALKSAAKANNIHLEYSFTPVLKSYYIEGIHNLYEFDAGELSGWMFSVNGVFFGYGCSEYELKDGDVIRWMYTCNLGKDVGEYFEE